MISYAQSGPQKVAVARREFLLKVLQRMESLSFKEKVEEYLAPKNDGKLRLYIDLTRLSKAVKREFHLLPNLHEALSKLGNSKIFS